MVVRVGVDSPKRFVSAALVQRDPLDDNRPLRGRTPTRPRPSPDTQNAPAKAGAFSVARVGVEPTTFRFSVSASARIACDGKGYPMALSRLPSAIGAAGSTGWWHGGGIANSSPRLHPGEGLQRISCSWSRGEKLAGIQCKYGLQEVFRGVVAPALEPFQNESHDRPQGRASESFRWH